MYLPEINWDKCEMCHPCEVRKMCKVRAIVKFDIDSPAIIDQTRCNGCGLCILECPFEAISIPLPLVR